MKPYDKACYILIIIIIASYKRQLSKVIKILKYITITRFVSPGGLKALANKTGIDIMIF